MSLHSYASQRVREQRAHIRRLAEKAREREAQADLLPREEPKPVTPDRAKALFDNLRAATGTPCGPT